ncbi:MAG: two-component regulator propeller domain-containing protein [Bacteroidota bacterium]
MFLRLFFISSLIIPHLSFGQADYVFHKLTTQQGLSHSTVYTITQDSKGFIWLGTREGLNRYDGYELETFYAPDDDLSGLFNNQILALLPADSLLYIGTQKGLNVYNYRNNAIQRITFSGKSLGTIFQIYQASDGAVYFCTRRGLFSIDTNGQLVQLTQNTPVLAIAEHKKNVFWMVTRQQIILINQLSETIKSYPHLKETSEQFLDARGNISAIYRDRQGGIWIGTVHNGLYHYVPEKDVFEPIIPIHQSNPIEANMVRAIQEDYQGNLWVGTESGLFVYDQQKQKFDHYPQTYDGSLNAPNDKAIYCIFRSAEDIMWMGTYFGGVNYVKQREKGFRTLKADGGKEALGGKAVSQIDAINGKLWIGTEDGGITLWDQSQQQFNYLRHSSQGNSLVCNNVHSIHEDGSEGIWIGTFLGGLNRYNPTTNEFTVYQHHPDDSNSLSNNYVYSILRDSRDTLWVGTQRGLNIFHAQSNTFSRYRPDLFANAFIYDMLEDQQGDLWFCTRSSGIFRWNAREKKFTHYQVDAQKSHGLNTNQVVSAYQDSRHRLWFGTLTGGLIRWDSTNQHFLAITQADGLPNNNVYGMLEDSRGNLWVSTNKGLSQVNPESGKIVNYTVAHGLTDNQFNFKSFFKDDRGYMYFGTVNGLCYFHPDSLQFNRTAPNVYLTDLKLFNQSIPIGEESLLSTHIDETKAIELHYHQNVITFDFVALNYFAPGNNTYAYFMEGFEDRWNEVQNQRSATYTNLSPGNYTFRIKASNGDESWSEEKQIQLTVLPPFWLSNWALALYGLLLLGAVYLYRRYLIHRHQEKMVLQLERVEREKMEELNQHKLNFFTYISHEFKTPLTLIIASIDKLLSRSGSPESSTGFQLIKKNATRLHFLIDQLMEFRKTETDHATLNLGRGDVVLFLKDTFDAFIPLFTRKSIAYQTYSNVEEYTTYFDADKLEKIITNLLSNAVKHTREHGEITMDLYLQPATTVTAGQLSVTIIDSGIGLFEGESEKIFKPFYRGQNNLEVVPGTGIGLALVNSLVNFLNGTIAVESALDKGTTIVIDLPLSSPADGDSALKVHGNKTLQIDQNLLHEDEIAEIEVTEPENGADFELLIVEDDKDLLKFLTDHFSQFYQVVRATDGSKAKEKIQRSMPDLVISDVMMPGGDGVSLCEKIKTNLNTSHIPVILLTAKSATQHKLEGLNAGADAYLAKPFNLKELELLVKNTLDSRIHLKKHFLKHGNLDNLDQPINNQDQDFINKLTTVVEQHLDNPDFNVSIFTKEAGISRTLLHLKLKKLVNLSASEFIKTLRIQRAAQLLKRGSTVSEAAFRVGFKDPSYFSRVFREQFSVSPSEYKDSPLATQ